MDGLKDNGTALVTGASAGIGAIYADRLAKRGYDLILVARTEIRLADLAARIRAETGRRVEVLPADLNVKADLARVEDRLRSDPRVTLLVNNAGVGAATPLLESNVDAMEEMIELNVTALTRLTYAAAPGFAARGYGTIINIASTVGISPETLNGVYGATKAYVIALTQSLHKELSGKGVRIQAVVPGVTATDFWRRVGLPYEQLPRETVMAPEAMVDAALAGLDLGETITIPALQNADEWNTYEALRQDLAKHLSLANPAPRYVHAG